MENIRDIKYVDRDFSNIKNQLVEFTKNYYPDTYNDFNPSSPGLMFIEMVAYVGDILSFYQDKQIQETFIQYSKDPKNIYNLAYLLGYRPKVTTAAETILDVFQVVDSSPSNAFEPDWTQASRISENASIRSTVSNVTFLTDKAVDFSFSSSLDPTLFEVESFDSELIPTRFILTKKVKAYSGEIKTITKSVGSATKFFTLTLEDSNIIEVIDIIDDGNNTWYEVPYLGQETVFDKTRNQGSDSSIVYDSLTLIKTDRRFVTRFDPNGKLTIQFGAGVLPSADTSFLPSLERVGLGTDTGISRLDHAYDPSNFLYSRTYGLAPSNTLLTIRYRTGGGIQSNVPANTLTEPQTVNITNGTGTLNTIAFTNISPATGGSNGDTLQEIKQNALRAFNEQGRTVSLQDYAVRCYSLTPNLGSIAKVYATQEQLSQTANLTFDSNPFSISLYVLSFDNQKKLVSTTTTLKENLKKYLSQYNMITDNVTIKDAFVVNIGVEYEVILYPNQPSSRILLECNNRIAEYFDVSNRDINQPIILSELYLLLDKVKGLQSAENIKIINKVGGNYSPFGYDIQSATRGSVVYPSLDPCIFEIKFPDIDIKGKVITI